MKDIKLDTENNTITIDGMEYVITPKEKPKAERWKPEEDETYWTIDAVGEVDLSTWTMNNVDYIRLEDYNVYQTKKKAQRINDVQRAQRKLWDIIERINDGWKPNWEDQSQCKGFLQYGHDGPTCVQSWSIYQAKSNEYYFDVEKRNLVLETVQEEMTKEELALLGLGEA